MPASAEVLKAPEFAYADQAILRNVSKQAMTLAVCVADTDAPAKQR